MTKRRAINPPDVFDSRQYGFSQAVVAEGTTTIHVSGQVGWDRDEALVGADLASQLDGAIANLAAVLAAAGAGLSDVATLRIYIAAAAADDLSPVAAALRRAFPNDSPAATWLVVHDLADPGLLVEIEATAVVA